MSKVTFLLDLTMTTESAGFHEQYHPDANTGPLEDSNDVWRGKVIIPEATFDYTLEMPTDPQLRRNDVVTIVAPGYGGIEKAYDGFRGDLASLGLIAATFKMPRSMGWIADLNPANLTRATELHNKALAGLMRAIGNDFGYDYFDIAGHSYGGRSGAETAVANPDNVQNLYLYGSVGVTEHDFVEMLVKSGFVAVNELPHATAHLVRDHGPGIIVDALRHVFRNLPRTVAEGVAAATSDIRENLEHLDSIGTRIGGVQFPSDGFFDPEAVRKTSDRLFTRLHVYEDPKAKHVALQTQPGHVAAAHVALMNEVESWKPDLAIVRD